MPPRQESSGGIEAGARVGTSFSSAGAPDGGLVISRRPVIFGFKAWLVRLQPCAPKPPEERGLMAQAGEDVAARRLPAALGSFSPEAGAAKPSGRGARPGSKQR